MLDKFPHRNLALVPGGVLLLALADWLTQGSASIGAAGALARLLLPTSAFGALVGWWADGVRRGGWAWAALPPAVYCLVRIGPAVAAHSRGIDWGYAALPAVAGLLAAFGTALRHQFQRDRQAGAIAKRLLSLPAEEGEEDLSEPPSIDEAVLTESGLLQRLAREDREAAKNSRMVGFAMGTVFLAAYHFTGKGWTLVVSYVLFAGTLAATIVAAFLAGRRPSPFDCLAAGYFELASLEFGSMLRISPHDVRARLGIGLAQFHLHNYDRSAAEMIAARHLGFSRYSVDLWVGIERFIALAHREGGRLSQAIRSLKNLLTLFPEHPQILYDLAVCYQKAGQNQAARRLFARAAALGHAEACEALGAMAHEQ